MFLGFEMLLQNEIRGCNFQNIAIHSFLSLLYLRLIEEYQMMILQALQNLLLFVIL
jgi:hypothetical protein